MPAIETNRAKIVRRLEAEGWALERHGAEHDVFKRGGLGNTVPRHRTLSIGVARQIAKKAGWF